MRLNVGLIWAAAPSTMDSVKRQVFQEEAKYRDVRSMLSPHGGDWRPSASLEQIRRGSKDGVRKRQKNATRQDRRNVRERGSKLLRRTLDVTKEKSCDDTAALQQPAKATVKFDDEYMSDTTHAATTLLLGEHEALRDVQERDDENARGCVDTDSDDDDDDCADGDAIALCLATFILLTS